MCGVCVCAGGGGRAAGGNCVWETGCECRVLSNDDFHLPDCKEMKASTLELSSE